MRIFVGGWGDEESRIQIDTTTSPLHNFKLIVQIIEQNYSESSFERNDWLRISSSKETFTLPFFDSIESSSPSQGFPMSHCDGLKWPKKLRCTWSNSEKIVRWACIAAEKRVLPLTVLIRMGPRNERGSLTCMEPFNERVESRTARRTSPFNDFVSC